MKQKKQVELSENGSGKLRLLEIISYKILAVQKEDLALDHLVVGGTKTYRIEEIPSEEVSIPTDELLVPVAHFQKEMYQTFGMPFLLKIKDNELFSEVKERIQKKLDVPEKDYEKYKFAIIVMGRLEYIPEDSQDIRVDIKKFVPHPVQTGMGMQARPWLGLDHVNKTPKRARYNYLEKAIKIHN